MERSPSRMYSEGRHVTFADELTMFPAREEVASLANADSLSAGESLADVLLSYADCHAGGVDHWKPTSTCAGVQVMVAPRYPEVSDTDSDMDDTEGVNALSCSADRTSETESACNEATTNSSRDVLLTTPVSIRPSFSYLEYFRNNVTARDGGRHRLNIFSKAVVAPKQMSDSTNTHEDGTYEKAAVTTLAFSAQVVTASARREAELSSFVVHEDAVLSDFWDSAHFHPSLSCTPISAAHDARSEDDSQPGNENPAPVTESAREHIVDHDDEWFSLDDTIQVKGTSLLHRKGGLSTPRADEDIEACTKAEEERRQNLIPTALLAFCPGLNAPEPQTSPSPSDAFSCPSLSSTIMLLPSPTMKSVRGASELSVRPASQYALAVLSARCDGMTIREVLRKTDWDDDDDDDGDDGDDDSAEGTKKCASR